MSHGDWERPVVIQGVLGWGNRKHGLEAYGPGGRWEGRGTTTGEPGDLLGDALEREGAHEGRGLIVVAIERFATGYLGELKELIEVVVDEWHERVKP